MEKTLREKLYGAPKSLREKLEGLSTFPTEGPPPTFTNDQAEMPEEEEEEQEEGEED